MNRPAGWSGGARKSAGAQGDAIFDRLETFETRISKSHFKPKNQGAHFH